MGELMSEIKVDTQIKLDAYKVISDAVEIGVTFGWDMAHKHQATPSAEHIKDEIRRSVMISLCDIMCLEEQ